jgi:acyl-coenzyme A thioesterase PaaI-like protein
MPLQILAIPANLQTDSREQVSHTRWKERRRDMLGARRIEPVERPFGIEAASRLLLEALSPWAQELGLLVESVESGRPAGAPSDWQPGAVIRLPFNQKLCRDGVICAHALMAFADAAMMLACAAAWNGYRAMNVVDHTMHFLRPVNFDVLADARVVRTGRAANFGRVMLSNAVDRRPVGMLSSAYAVL